LALDRCVGSPLDSLVRRSFQHAATPDDIAADWGRVYGLVVPKPDPRGKGAPKLDWLSDGVIVQHQLGTTETTAIVHAPAFTSAIMSAAQGNGAEQQLQNRDEVPPFYRR
jgi:hypothetical protein